MHIQHRICGDIHSRRQAQRIVCIEAQGSTEHAGRASVVISTIRQTHRLPVAGINCQIATASNLHAQIGL